MNGYIDQSCFQICGLVWKTDVRNFEYMRKTLDTLADVT